MVMLSHWIAGGDVSIWSVGCGGVFRSCQRVFVVILFFVVSHFGE